VEAQEYRTLFEFEEWYWWYRSLHALLLDVLRQHGARAGWRVLDAGCGTGQNLANIARRITPRAFGVDLSPEVLQYWPKRALHRVCLGSVNELPFADGCFDAVLCVDVLECAEVATEEAIGELWRVVRPGGMILVVVPAHQWLLTEGHHRAVHATRRYSRRSLRILLESRPFDLVRLTYVFAATFPMIAGYRLALRVLRRSRGEPARSELRPLPWALNELLSRIMGIERRLLRLGDMPFGSSVLAVARRRA